MFAGGTGVGVLVGGIGVFVAVGTGVGVSVGGTGVFVAAGLGVGVSGGVLVGVAAETFFGVGVQSLRFFDVPAPAGSPALEGTLTHEASFAPWSA